MRKSIITIGIAIMILAALAAGCTGAKTSTNSTASDTGRISKLVIGTTANVVDVNILDQDYANYVRPLTMDGLLMYTENGSLVPGLADSWETDLRNWTFHIAHNATFHDGSPVTARDVKFSLEYMMDKDPNMKIRFNLVDSVETPDDYTVIVHLKQPSYNFIVDATTNLEVYPEKVFASVDSPKTYNDANATIGTGPYRFVSFDKAAGVITLKAYEDYRYGPPAVDTIEIRMFKNEDTMMMALQNGEIDTTYTYAGGIGYYYVPKLLKNDDIRIMMVKNIAVPSALWFHTQKYPYNVTAFREAVGYAINYPEVNNLFTAGYGSVPNAGYLPGGSPGYVDTAPMAYDVNRSKALLDSLGFKDVDADGYREYPNGTKFQPELLVGTDTTDNVRLGETVRNYLNAVGINAKLKVTDKGTVSSTLRQSKSYEMVIARTTNFGMMAYAGYGSLYVDARNIGYAMVDDPGFQATVDELLNTSDPQRRSQLAAELQAYYAEQHPVIPLYWCDYIQPYDAKYEGWSVDPIFGILSHRTFENLHVAE